MLSSPSKVLTALAVGLFSLLLCSPALASNDSHANNKAQLRLSDAHGAHVAPGVLLNTQAKMRITGLINHVEVTQTFINRHPFAVNAQYVFPLPSESAVHAMVMTVGERKIVGKIAEKQAAERQYQAAKRAGKRAALVNQQRANMFTSRLANLGPGEQVRITLQYQEMVSLRDAQLSVRLPMTFTPRYHPRQYRLDGADKVATVSSPELEKTAGATAGATASGVTGLMSGWMSPRFVQQATAQQPLTNTQPKLQLQVDIDFGLALHSIRTPHYKADIRNPSFGRYQLLVSDESMNRDFVLRAKVEQSDKARAAFFRQTAQSGDYGLLMLLPPSDEFSAQQRLARELIFVIDSSGSMHGSSMQAAKQALFYALDNMNENDSFNIIDFDSTARLFRPSAVAANEFNRNEAERFVYNLDADGGTEIAGALHHALDAKQHPGFVRQVVFLTDGSVSNEQALFDLIKARLGDSRLFTVGIGSAPNSYFMRRAAQVGRGSYTFISDGSEVQAQMQALIARLANPALRDLHLAGARSGELDYWPKPLPDLYFGEPLMVAIKLDSQQQDIHINATSQHGPLRLSMPMHESARNYERSEAIARVWARQQIASLLLYNEQQAVREQVLELALKHQLLSPFTAFIAVDETPAKSPAMHDEQVPNPVAQGQRLMRFAQTDGQSLWHVLLGMVLMVIASAWLKVRGQHG
ncbi:marine proteobacterial sortase target protein [Pseudoalteromonas sp. CO325X]|uniref:marine proteobacterial sortase target protein n=1 Tax=Pseudoalteromonas sp. CO325X TaxID=1777262 RepID=UPI001023DBFC|nr:marine proteobacterial sortase target protein [Pseudoalteromonas sp. CO325X]RZF77741.1 marine proteobacterial sortase target protein [Pseudoalteromonas sp. CO325X]